MTEDMSVYTFMQQVYDLLDDLREINKLPTDIVIADKILKNLPMKYETFVKMLLAKKVSPSLASLGSTLYMEEMEMHLRSKPNEEALMFKLRNNLQEKQR